MQPSDVLKARGVNRLCHFTPAPNLSFVVECGLLSRSSLEQSGKWYRWTDAERADGHPELVSFSVEYPNALFFDRAREREQVFDDWVVLGLDVELVDRIGVLASPANAALGSGRYLRSGTEVFRDLYRNDVPGKSPQRARARLRAAPTSLQAEVMVPPPIGIDQVKHVIFRDDEQALRETSRLRQLRVGWPAAWSAHICSEMFEGHRLEALVAAGVQPVEHNWARFSSS